MKRYILISIASSFLATMCTLSLRYILIPAVSSFLPTACTLSFQNIHTEGTASDLVDENQTTSPQVTADISVPVSVVPK